MRLVKRVLVAAGGSGGHIFPAIALCESLKERSPTVEIRLVGSAKELDRRIFEKESIGYSLLSDNKLPSGPSLKLIGFLFKGISDIVKTFFIFIDFKPDVAVGFGGYVSFPVVIMARLFRVPRLIHEQNVVPGRANKFLLSWADKIALSFEGTKKYLGNNAAKAVLTGNPIRRKAMKAEHGESLKRFGLSDSKFSILVIGGSQGAHNINEKFLQAIGLIEPGTRSKLQVIHITGIKDYEWAILQYKDLPGLDYRVFSFIDRIEEAYGASDLIITRSGSSALFEAAHFAKPMILVPYPFARSHQVENAKAFSDNGAAIMIEEKDLSSQTFKDNILNLFNDRSRLSGIADAVKRLSMPEASERLAGEVLSLS